MRETNTKFVVRIMEQASTGPLMQAFILEAVRTYAADILATETPPDADTGPLTFHSTSTAGCQRRSAAGSNHVNQQ